MLRKITDFEGPRALSKGWSRLRKGVNCRLPDSGSFAPRVIRQILVSVRISFWTHFGDGLRRKSFAARVVIPYTALRWSFY